MTPAGLTLQQTLTETMRVIEQEVKDALERYGEFNSYHEGYAVLLEEVDELWDEIKKRSKDDSSIHFEAKQVAAMAVKLMMLAEEQQKK